MDNASFAARAIAGGPPTVAPPSFDGHGWLVVVNLAAMTFTAIVALMFAVDATRDWRRNRGKDLPSHPVSIWRWTGFCLAMGMCLTRASDAVVLWNWDTRDPVGTGWWLTFQRFVDPIAMCFGLTGLALLYLSARGMVVQLRRRPFPIDMWSSLPMLKRPAYIALLSLIAAIGVVSTR